VSSRNAIRDCKDFRMKDNRQEAMCNLVNAMNLPKDSWSANMLDSSCSSITVSLDSKLAGNSGSS